MLPKTVCTRILLTLLIIFLEKKNYYRTPFYLFKTAATRVVRIRTKFFNLLRHFVNGVWIVDEIKWHIYKVTRHYTLWNFTKLRAFVNRLRAIYVAELYNLPAIYLKLSVGRGQIKVALGSKWVKLKRTTKKTYIVSMVISTNRALHAVNNDHNCQNVSISTS